MIYMVNVSGKKMWRQQLKLASEGYISRMSIHCVKNCHWWGLTSQQMKIYSLFDLILFLNYTNFFLLVERGYTKLLILHSIYTKLLSFVEVISDFLSLKQCIFIFFAIDGANRSENELGEYTQKLRDTVHRAPLWTRATLNIYHEEL